jgi:hypothetical protein
MAIEADAFPLEECALYGGPVRDPFDGDLAVVVDDAPPGDVVAIFEREESAADAASRARLAQDGGDAAITQHLSSWDRAHDAIHLLGKFRHA